MENPQSTQSESRPGFIFEGDPEKAKNSVTGESSIPTGTQGKVTVDAKEWKNFLNDEASEAESNGDFAKAARLRGQSYNPSLGEKVFHTALKMKSATVQVLLAAATPLALILLWEGVRLVIPRARKLPGFIKYKSEATGDQKVVRLSASGTR